ncbi:MAG: glutamine-hydrolyzing carbamoyl-phosphate synthase small subunit [Deltaproteobacteria bacterium]|jgi:carbamoyl-phosphate synthase small subunit|nr:glutamine-hydrolyzing carbamoyl-phosphate synthase small subunit [Deltaproteobacteria bacterium]
MKALLVLEDGFSLEGHSVTGPCEAEGEVIFNTGMVGYQELLTDPSYAGQMVCMSYPLIGNCGVNEEDMESSGLHLSALLVKECCKEPSNWRARESLPDFLIRNGVPAITDLDTRALTLHIRTHGAMRGVISTSGRDVESLRARAQVLPAMTGQNLASRVAPAGSYRWEGKPVPVTLEKDGSYAWPGKGPRLVVYDLGATWGMLRLLAKQGFDMLVVPPSFTPAQVEATDGQAVFFSSGPGDPAALTELAACAATLTARYPTAGVCLGSQILGKAFGGSVEKLKFGHHGSNHPVKDLATGHVEISLQRHGFSVDISTASGLEASHVNLNDGALEGFEHTTRPVMAVQYYPAAEPGPYENRYFFGRFRQMVREAVGI